MDLFGGTIRTLENSLDYASAKNRVISDNIANIDTPNYKAKDVEFKNVLNSALESNVEAKRTNAKHLSFNSNMDSAYRVTTNNSTLYNHNGNNVDVDKEMAELAKNQIYYNALIDRINGKFGSLQTVIRGGN
ncbi:flagellar basal body rod protein FlgB [Oceanobacillus salinisoli]|uniref:flagellar basal body rod protein FlgB n=1 Tax=Oceanobacillus salinisoli TaxID=2678611 RepID=UPI0012E29F54|nr:flagellar basal body rod protein FlgB [Oceanobacillus salinisoli]